MTESCHLQLHVNYIARVIVLLALALTNNKHGMLPTNPIYVVQNSKTKIIMLLGDRTTTQSPTIIHNQSYSQVYIIEA